MNRKTKNISNYITITVIVFILVVLSAAGVYYFKSFRKNTLKEGSEYLISSASAKAAVISSWYSGIENKSLEEIKNNPLNVINKYRKKEERNKALNEWLESAAGNFNAESAALYDRNKDLIITSGTGVSDFPGHMPADNISWNKPVNFTDISITKGKITIAGVLPLFGNSEEVLPTEYLLLRINLSESLIKNLKSTPEFFKSESFDILAAGSGIDLKENRLFNRTESSHTNLTGPPVFTQIIKTGAAIRGVDNNGVSVTACFAKLPIEGWYVSAKADNSEIERPIEDERVKIIVFISAVCAAFIILTFFLLRYPRKNSAQKKELRIPIIVEAEKNNLTPEREIDLKDEFLDSASVFEVQQEESALNEEVMNAESEPSAAEFTKNGPAEKILEYESPGAEIIDDKNEIIEIEDKKDEDAVPVISAQEAGKEEEKLKASEEINTVLEITSVSVDQEEGSAEIPLIIEEEQKETIPVAETKEAAAESMSADMSEKIEIEISAVDSTTQENVQEDRPEIAAEEKDDIIEAQPDGEPELEERAEKPAVDTASEIKETFSENKEEDLSVGDYPGPGKTKTSEEENNILSEVEMIEGNLRGDGKPALPTEYKKPGKTIVNKLNNIKTFGLIPKILFEINLLLNKEPENITKLAGIIIKEQGITTKVLSVANSPYYGLKQKVTSIDYALLLLGTEEICRLVTALSLSDAVRFPSTPNLRYLDYWFHSMAVGFTSRDIALKLGFTEIINEAFLGGIFHDLGIQILAKHFPKELELITAHINSGKNAVDAELEIMGSTHQEIGRYSAEKWGLPDGIYDALSFHHAPNQSDGNKVITGIINISDWLTHQVTKTESFWEQGIELDEKNYKILGFKTVQERNTFLEDYYPALHITLNSIQF